MRRTLLLTLTLFALVWGCTRESLPEPIRPVAASIEKAVAPIEKALTPQPTVAAAATANLRVYFTSPGENAQQPGNPAEVLAGYVAKAEKTIDVCAFELDNVVITNALLDAHKRGVRIRLVTETNYLEESGIEKLQAAGVPIIDDQRDGALMHNKFMVFDNKAVWTGSMNFTENCAYKNNNHGIYVADERIAANYATKFSWMFDQHKFGGAPTKNDRIPNPIVTLADGTIIENYFSTHDRVAEHVLEQVNRAQKSIHFLAFSYTLDPLGQLMIQKSKAGVAVQGVFETSQAASGYSEYEPLRTAGGKVEVYLDANPRNMHHKVIVLDGETTVAGSFNFSDSADKKNDENVLVIRSRAISSRFEEEFRDVFLAAKGDGGNGLKTAGTKR